MTTILGSPPVAPAEAAEHRSLWRDNDFRLFWIGETTSKLGGSISGVAIPLVAITVLQASTFQVGMLTAASWLPWLLIGLPAGAWVDRLPRRPLMLICNVVSMVLLLSVPVCAWFGLLTVEQLLVTALLTGSANVLFQTAYQVFLPSLVGKERLPEANAKMQGAESATHIAGPGLAGIIAGAVGVLGGLFADAASFLVSTLCLLRVRAAEIGTQKRKTSLLRDIGEGLRFVAHDRYLRVFTVFGAASNLVLTGYQAILVVFLVRELGLGTGMVGALLTAMSAGGILGALCARRIANRFGTAHGTIITLLCTSPFAMLIPMSGPGPRLGFAIAGGVILGGGVVAGNVIKGSFRQMYTPHALLGRVTVSAQFLNYGTIPLGGLLGGALGGALGLRPTMWLMTALVALAPLILLIGPIRTNRDLPQHWR
ncbi:MFS transporter, partial [Rhizocola hellebori]|uniref:MFS transporter n=1 Tax=Rhizocola hellebori TaxID=1392758 RepID=UPI001940BC18